MAQPPKLSESQRRAALAKAAEARRKRAEIKELLRTGSLTLAEVLEQAETDDIVAGTKIGSLLPALPGFGKIKAKRFMEEHGISETRRLRGLGIRQKEVLLEHFS